MNKPVVRKLRCAVYTRKSSEEGLEQEFNSLHAQSEACEAYITSQRAEGWVLVRDQYDDGGISLSLQGKAMAAAATGDLVPVQNTLSKKVIQAVATGPGSAAVGPQAQALQARSQPVRFAAR